MRTELEKRDALIIARVKVDYQFDDGTGATGTIFSEALKAEPHHVRWNGIEASGETYGRAISNLRDEIEKL